MTNKPHVGILLLWLSLGLTGCNDTHPSLTPIAPSPTPQPVPQPAGLQPTVTAITPNTASTAGEAWATITGAQFQPGATVILGNRGLQTWVQNEATIMFWTTAHPAGTVDVVVTNPGGLSGTLASAFTYASPGSFDPNGDWIGYARPEFDYDKDMRLAIRNNSVINLVCGSSETVTLLPPPSVHDGEFSFRDDDGLAISGHLVSPVGAVGTINAPGCEMTTWWAAKSAAIQTVRRRFGSDISSGSSNLLHYAVTNERPARQPRDRQRAAR